MSSKKERKPKDAPSSKKEKKSSKKKTSKGEPTRKLKKEKAKLPKTRRQLWLERKKVEKKGSKSPVEESDIAALKAARKDEPLKEVLSKGADVNATKVKVSSPDVTSNLPTEKDLKEMALSKRYEDIEWTMFDVAAVLTKADEDIVNLVDKSSVASPSKEKKRVRFDTEPLIDYNAVRDILALGQSYEVELALGIFTEKGFNPGVTAGQFQNIKSVLDYYSGQVDAMILRDDNFPSVYTVEIKGENSGIRKIIRENGVTFQKKSRSRFTMIENPTWWYRISSSKEESIGPVRFTPEIVRRIERWSYFAPTTDQTIAGFRFDLSTVIETKNGGRSEVSYEVEIERFLPVLKAAEFRHLGQYLTPKLENALKLVLLLSQNMVIEVKRYLSDPEYVEELSAEAILDSERFFQVVRDVNSLLRVSYVDRIDSAFMNKPTNVKVSDLLFGPEYALTSKLDGERRFLFIKDGAVYLLNPPFSIELVGASSNMPSNTLLDGEFMQGIPSEEEVDKPTGGVIDEFYAFDCVIYGGTDVRSKPLRERLEFLKKALSSTISSLVYRRRVVYREKPYVFGKLRDSIEKILEYNEKFENDGRGTDGIIFQPVNEGYKNLRTRKWKDPKNITIDFIAKPVKREIQLFSGDGKKDTVRFQVPGFSGVVSLEDVTLTYGDDTSESTLNQVAEYRWTGKTFTAIRLRADKDYPNALHVAKDNWDDIMDPITLDALRGLNTDLVSKAHSIREKQLITNNADDAGAGVISVGLTLKNLVNILAIGVAHIFVTNSKEEEQRFSSSEVTFVKPSIVNTRAIDARVENENVKAIYAFKVHERVPVVQLKGFVETATEVLNNGDVVIGTVRTTKEDKYYPTMEALFLRKGFVVRDVGMIRRFATYSKIELEYNEGFSYFVFVKGEDLKPKEKRKTEEELQPETEPTVEDIFNAEVEPVAPDVIPEIQAEKTKTVSIRKGKRLLKYVVPDEEEEETEEQHDAKAFDRFNFLSVTEGETVQFPIMIFKSVIFGARLDASSILRAVLSCEDESYRNFARVSRKTGVRRPELDESVFLLRQKMVDWLTPQRFKELADGEVKRKEIAKVVNASNVAIHRLRNTRLRSVREKQYAELKKKHERAGTKIKATFSQFLDEFTNEENREALEEYAPIGTVGERAYLSYISNLADSDYPLGESVLEILMVLLEKTIFVVNGGVLSKVPMDSLLYEKGMVIVTNDKVFYYALGFKGKEETRYLISNAGSFKRLWKKAQVEY